MAKELTPDQKRAQTRKEKYGEDFYRRIGAKGGRNNSTKFDSKRASEAVKARWAKYRAEQAKKEEGEA